MARSSSNKSGCGCLIVIVIAIAFCINKCSNANTSSSETSTKTSTTTSHPKYYNDSPDGSLVENELSEEDKLYIDNSLTTGATPYKSTYGKNYRCPRNRCSGIKVTAPHESDIIVIIKHNDLNGKVTAHGYIKAGDTYQFDIPDGTYQTFFYYGKGWNPNKVMTGGVTGGFVLNEIFSKDNPQDIYGGVLSYVLQLQRNGNFQTKGSNKSECF